MRRKGGVVLRACAHVDHLRWHPKHTTLLTPTYPHLLLLLLRQ